MKKAYPLIPFILLLGLGLDIYLPSVPNIMSRFDISAPMCQLTLTIFMFSFGVGQLVAGPLGDRFGTKQVISLGCLIFAIGSIICAVTTHFYGLLCGRGIQALGACAAHVCTFAYVRKQYNDNQASQLFTILKASMGLAPILAPLLGALIQYWFSFRANFYFLCAFGLFGTMVSLSLTPTSRATQNPFRGIMRILRHRDFIRYSVVIIGTQACMFGFFSHSPRFYMLHHQLEQSWFAVLFSANALGFIITGWLLNQKVTLWGPAKSIRIAAVFYQISAAFMIAMDPFLGYWALLWGNLGASAGSAIMLGASTTGALLPFHKQAGLAAALLGSFEFLLGGGLGTLIVFSPQDQLLSLATMIGLTGIISLGACRKV